MRYFLDTEFLEGTQKKLFGRTNPTIDLISIGLVDENGREFYAISSDFNLKEAWNRWDKKDCCNMPKMCGAHIQGECEGFKKEYWIRDNVLRPIYYELLKLEDALTEKAIRMSTYYSMPCDREFCFKTFKFLINKYGRRNCDIANDICAFIYGDDCGGSGMSAIEMAMKYEINDKTKEPEFYAYYGAYDWVCFAWLFGKMINLPKGFPMYCRDLKQMMDEKGLTKEWKQRNCPDPEGEHNALVDANWTLKLYNAITQK